MQQLLEEIEKTFPLLKKHLGKKGLLNFIRCPHTELCFYHFGLGSWIRNTLLKESSPLYIHFLSTGITEKDTMSTFIINLFHIHIRIKYYRKSPPLFTIFHQPKNK